MKHYIAVLIPQAEGSWRAHFPDFPGCRAEGPTIEAAIDASGAIVAEHARELQRHGVSLPTPQSYEDVRHRSNGWGAARGIDWSKAVISMIRLSVGD
jgi:predicted RNase H-like HicB family nuclease